MAENFNKAAKLLVRYAWENNIYTLVGGYFIFSLILFAFFNIDIGIPCLFKTVTGYRCPGCGLSHAFSHLLRFEFAEAWEHNKLCYIVLPAGTYYVIKDFLDFKKRSSLNRS